MAKKVKKKKVVRKSLYYRFFETIAKCIFKKRTVVYSEEPEEEGGVVFVSNHAGAIAPANMALWFDRPVRPWIISYIFDKKVNSNFIYHDFFFARGSEHKRFQRMLAKIVAILLRPLLTAWRSIKVYRTEAEVLSTFKESLTALMNGENLIIFPESPEKRYQYVNAFSDGFAELGRMYYKLTGKPLKFYPTYIGAGLKTINVGDPVVYNPENPDNVAERVRISDALAERIQAIAESLPEHEATPYKTEKFYEYYSEFVDDLPAYWQFCNQKRSE